MINIYSVAEAEKTILRRDMALEPTVPPRLQASLDRLFGEGSTPETAVSHLLKQIRQRGDAALRHWTAQIDGVDLGAIRLEPAAIAAAAERVEPELLDALRLAAGRIREFHQHQPLPSWETNALGGRLGQKVSPLKRVGVYVPGGTAPLPSSLLMSVIPAQVAGVREIVVATPPQRSPSSDGATGRIADVILAAAHICGVETIYQMGGAQAIGALAFGTESVGRVDKIVGPGGLFVTLAKRQVYGLVGIDGLYGPTETAVIADDSANPVWVAADLLAQAEHDVLATAILFTPSRALATAVQCEIARQTEQLSRDDVIAISLANQSGIVITQDLAEATRLADTFAPEHLCIATENPRQWAEQIHCAGGIFLGERSFEVLGDYVAGPSHVMPTGGTARFASPLTAVDFVRITSIIELDDETSARLSPAAARIAQAELLTAHANAAQLRVKN